MDTPKLRRRLSLPMITLYGLGTTVGGGIYVLVGTVAGRAGYYAPFSFLLAALMVALTAFSFAELSARFPKSAGEAIFVKEGFNSRSLAILVGYLVVFNGIVSSAALTDGFVGYFQTFLDVPSWIAIFGIVLTIGLLACWGIGESVMIASIVTVIEIGGLVIIVWVGRDAFFVIPDMTNQMLPPFNMAAWSGILAGSFLAFYAFIGFEDMVNVAEEVKNPQRTLPIAIILTLSVTTVIYVLVVLVVIVAVPPQTLATSSAPLALVFETKTGNTGEFISIISILAVLNGALIQVIMAARVLYGMAAQGWAPKWLGAIHPLTRTPIIATLSVVCITVILALTFNIDVLAETTTLIMLIISILVNLALFRLKQKQPTYNGQFNLPSWVPLAGFCISLIFCSFVAIDLFPTLHSILF